MAAHLDEAGARKLFLGAGNERFEIVEHAAEIAAADADENVNDGKDVVVGNDRRTAAACDGGDVGEKLGVACAGPAGGDGNGGERGMGALMISRPSTKKWKAT